MTANNGSWEGTTPPRALELRPGGIPRELADRPQWVCWKYLPPKKPGDDWRKVPFDPADGRWSQGDHETWGRTFTAACAAAVAYDGIGYVFSKDDPYTGIDLDDVRNPETGELLPWAATLVDRLATFADVSPSGTGVKLFVRGKLPAGAETAGPARADGGSVEMYSRGRYFALTGWPLNEDAESPPVADCPGLADLHAELIAKPKREERERKARARREERVAAAAPPTPEQADYEKSWARRADTHGLSVEERAVRYVRDIPPGVQGQRGSNPTLWAARCVAWGFDLGGEVAYRVLAEHYNPRCQPPWSDADLRRKCQQADTVKFSKPRGWLLGDTRNGDHKPPGSPRAKPTLMALPDLLAAELPPITWAVAGVLPEGLTVLAGKPKLGKSFMALNLAMTVAGGGKALGNIAVTPGDVLYLSLEDRWIRLQNRARKMLRGAHCDASRRLKIATSWARAHEGGIEDVTDWIREAENPRLVIVDVWQKFKPPVRTGGSQYEQDYAHATAVKKVADDAACSSLILHHTKKAEAEDVFDEVSGTLGLTGAADATLILARARNDSEAVLHMTGRDLEEGKLALRFDGSTLTWVSEGPAERREEGKVRKAIFDTLKANPGSSYSHSDLANLTGQKDASVRQACLRMVQDGAIRKVGYRYSWPSEAGGEETAF